MRHVLNPDVKLICFYGPESTGKTEMAKRIARIYETEYVPEVAREMITSNNFTIDDIIAIGHAQTQRVIEKSKTATRILICDSDLITTQIYCRYYLREAPPVLYELEKQIHYHHYFLFDIDTPWVADGLRDLGDKREMMFNIFKSELDKRKVPYTIVQGTFEEREQKISLQLRELV